MPPALRRLQRKLGPVPNGGRLMIEILSATVADGLGAVQADCAEVLSESVHSSAVFLNILARRPERRRR